MRWRPGAFFLACLCACFSRAAADSPQVVIYGSTPGGIAAALSAAKGGATVLLVEPTARIGGLTTCGLSYSDFRSFESLSGFFLEFAQEVEADYVKRYGPDSEQVKASWRGTHGEPSVNLRVFEQMLARQSRVRVVKEHVLTRLTLGELTLGRRRILSAEFRASNGGAMTVKGAMFIDASYEGDLMAMVGEPYHAGRESRAQYGEPEAGDENGHADAQIQGYNFRLIMTTVPENRLMPRAPDDYKREDFTGVLAHFASGKLKRVFSNEADGIYRTHFPFLPNGKADVNDAPGALVRLSMPDINDGYPDGDAATRARIVREHLTYNVGLLYFLQNDAEVPPAIRDDARRWGWCKDEFTETGGLPPQLYIREARRLVGQYVFTARDAEQLKDDARAMLHPASIAMGDYVHNSHGTGRTGTRFDGKMLGTLVKRVPPHQIPYGVIVPIKTENLLVPVALSASHVGFCLLRLEPIWASLGQAAGWAVSQAVRKNVSVQKVDVAELQRALLADRSATIYISDLPPDSPDFAAVQWFGMLGGFHGLAAFYQLPPKSLGGQYNAAFPGHAAQLELVLDSALGARWLALAEKAGIKTAALPKPDRRLTRGEWLRAAFAARDNGERIPRP